MDLKQRGMLEDTLIVWGGEFGRTCFSQGQLTEDNFGRDHHSDAFTILMAGGGVKSGLTYGATDLPGGITPVSPIYEFGQWLCMKFLCSF